MKDETEQSLALTNRVWVPPMEYTSVAPYAQLSYDIGPVTFSGGMRREDGELSVERLHDHVLPQSRVRRGRHARLPGRPVQRRRDLAHHRRLVGVRLLQRRLHAAEHRHPAAQHQPAGPVGRRHPRPAGDHLRQQGSRLQLARRRRRASARSYYESKLRPRRLAQRRSGDAGLRAESRAGGDQRLRVHAPSTGCARRLEVQRAVLAHGRQDHAGRRTRTVR